LKNETSAIISKLEEENVALIEEKVGFENATLPYDLNREFC